MNLIKRGIRSLLWRSGIGRATAALFWRRKDSGGDMRYLYYNEVKLLGDLPINFDEDVFNKFLITDLHRWEIQDGLEYVLEMDDILIEPERCLGTKGFNQLIEQTVVFKAHYQYPYIFPHLLNKKKAIYLENAILYDGSATRNLYHHLIETVCRLSVLSKVNIPANSPVLINRFVFENPFFQYLYNKSAQFRSFNWRIQEPGEWLRVGKLYRPKAVYFDKESWDFTRKMYNLEDITPFRKVFLSRDKKRFTRGLKNEDEVIELLKNYGFELIYAEDLSIAEQERLFQETEYLVALTGMGLVQQFFMKYDKAHIIEIIPVNRLMPEYYCQAFSLGIKYYDVVLGEDIDNVPLSNKTHKRYESLKEYEVEIDKLEKAVQKMLGAAKDKRIYGNSYLSQ